MPCNCNKLLIFWTRAVLLVFPLYFIPVNKSIAQNRHEIDSLLQVIEKSRQDTNQVITFLRLGDLFYDSQPDTANKYFQKALEISESIDFESGKARSLKGIGTVYRMKGENDLALENLMKAQDIFSKMGEKEKLATCYNNIGYTHKLIGEFDKAIEYFYKALEIADELGDKRQMARSYNNIGSVHQASNSNDRAIEVFENSLGIYQEIDYSTGVAISYVNLGICYFNKNDFEKALEYHENALIIHMENNHKHGISICYVNMSEIYRALGMYEKAIEYSLKSVELFEEMGFKEGMASAYSNIANYKLELADSLKISVAQRSQYLSESVEYGNKTMELAKEMSSPQLENSAADVLVKAYKSLGDYKNALKYAEIVTAARDSMFLEEKTNAILEIEAKYETEKKQQQIELQETQLVAKDATIKQQKLYRNALGTGLLAVILIIIVIVYAYIQKRKDNRKIKEQNEQISEANEELVVLNEAISKQNLEILDSINYAERIQSAMLPPQTYITELLNENFILFKPRDIVSGDFYWIKQVNQYIVIVAADCTGHGVPGAFMSILGISFLTEIVQKREITQANQVLNELRKQIKYSLRQHGDPDEAKDGIDMALCVLDHRKNRVQFSGANNPLYLIRDNDGKTELKEIKADRMPLGYYQGKDRPFTNHEIDLEPGDTLYMFSDGFLDQKGGKDNKRFMSKNFKSLLLKIQEHSMQDQKGILDRTLSDWMGSKSQTDDILVLGVRT